MNRYLGTLPVSQIFGPTFQGEGPRTGQRVSFLRLGHCNLTCDWCDTPYTWDADRYDLRTTITPTAPDTVLAALAGHDTDRLVLSGGEPLIWHCHQPLLHTLAAWRGLNGRVDVESNATIVPGTLFNTMIDWYTVSPKLTTDDPVAKRIKPTAIAWFRDQADVGRACFKFVCATASDVHDVATFTVAHRIPAHHVWIMPQGDDNATVTAVHRHIAAAILDTGFHTSTRLHTLLWDNTPER